MVLNDWGKLVLLSLFTVGAFVLFFAPDVDTAVPVGLLGTVLGYITGNGRVALTGKAPSAVIVSSESRLEQ